jgi:glucosamine-6-phosphate deaminase
VQTKILESKTEMGRLAASDGAQHIRKAIADRGHANIILATGASQFEMLSALTEEADIAWPNVSVFHLDEYVGMPVTHPASFRRYLKERFVEKLPAALAAFHFIDAEDDCSTECRRLGEVIREHPIDVAFVGIGENGHLAFNDPPADFDTRDPYLVVDLDEACRHQQHGEGWFETLDDVPRQAVSMSIRQIIDSRAIVCTVPDERKAQAVRDTVAGPVTPNVPASILQQHEQAVLYLDRAAASMLSDEHVT